MAEEAATTDTTTAAPAATAPATPDVTKSVDTAVVAAPEVKAEPKADATTDAAQTDGLKEDAETDAKDEGAYDAAALKLPDGYKADDPAFVESTKVFANLKFTAEGKLTQTSAQELINTALARDVEMAKARDAANAEAWKKTGDAWKATTAKENTPEQLSDAKSALGKWFDTDTVKLFESMRFTDHPGLVKGLRAIGAAIKDDTFVPGNAGSRNGSGDARKSFPNSNMNP